MKASLFGTSLIGLLVAGCPRTIQPTDVGGAPYRVQQTYLAGKATIPWRLALTEDDDDGKLDVAIALGGDLWLQPTVFFDEIGTGGRCGLTPLHAPTRSFAQHGYYTQVAYSLNATGRTSIFASTATAPVSFETSHRTTSCGSGVFELDLSGSEIPPRNWTPNTQVRDFQVAILDPERNEQEMVVSAVRRVGDCGANVASQEDSKHRQDPPPSLPWLTADTSDEPNSAPKKAPPTPGIRVLAAPQDAGVGVLVVKQTEDGASVRFGIDSTFTEGGETQVCATCLPGPLRVFDVNNDGYPDIIASFDGHSVLLVLGPLRSPQEDLDVECTDHLALGPQGGVSCLSTEGMAVSQIDAAFVPEVRDSASAANDLVLAVTAGCFNGHAAPQCSGVGRLLLWHSGGASCPGCPAKVELDYGPTEAEIVGGSARHPQLAVSGASPSSIYCSAQAELLTISGGTIQERRALYDGPVQSFALDIEPFWTRTWSRHTLVSYASDRSHLTLPGTSPIQPISLIEDLNEVPPCPTNDGARCWVWDRRSNSVYLPESRGFQVNTAILESTAPDSPLPDLVFANAMPGLGVFHLTPSNITEHCGKAQSASQRTDDSHGMETRHNH